MRLAMWEGRSRVDLIETFAPWALQQEFGTCAIDGLCCCIGKPSNQQAFVPVSEENPLHKCRHFMGGIPTETSDCDGFSITHFYKRVGITLVPTVVDGDCGPDTACLMLGTPQTLDNRSALR